MTPELVKAVEGMKPGDRRFIIHTQVVCVESEHTRDDFKADTKRYITLADHCETLHPNDVATRIVKVVRG